MTVRLERMLWIAALLLLATGGARAALAARRGEERWESPIGLVSRMAWPLNADSIDRLAEETVRTNLFRPERASVAAAENPPERPVQSPQRVEPKPRLVLRGTLGGPPWTALVDGIPGRPGTIVVRVGDVIGTLSIKMIRGDAIVISRPDTSWTLTVGRP